MGGVWLYAFIGLFLTLVVVADWWTGDRLDLSFFYAVGIMAVGWVGGSLSALGAVARSAVIHLGAATLNYDRFGRGGLWLLSEAFRVAAWLFMGLGAADIRRRMETIARQRDEIARAKAEIDANLEVARRVQGEILSDAIPSLPKLDIAIRCRMLLQTGGDFYAFKARDGRLFCCVADVSGKGFPAALVTGMLRGILESEHERYDDPAFLLGALNARLCPFLAHNMFVTCFFVVLDYENGTLEYSNAGHDPALICHDGLVTELTQTGLPLGILPDETYTSHKLQWLAGCSLLIYTDGLTTARIDGDQRLGDDPVREMMTAHHFSSAEHLAERVLSLLPAQQEDDVVVLSVKAVGPEGPPLRGAAGGVSEIRSR